MDLTGCVRGDRSVLCGLVAVQQGFDQSRRIGRGRNPFDFYGCAPLIRLCGAACVLAMRYGVMRQFDV